MESEGPPPKNCGPLFCFVFLTGDGSMSMTVIVTAAIFLLGAVVGALLTRLQWVAFKQKVLREMMEQLGGDPSLESESTSVGRLNDATFIAPYVDGSPPASAELVAGAHAPSGIAASPALQRFLEQNQMELDRIPRNVQALWDADGPLGPDSNRAERRNRSDRRRPRVRYARWFTPNRALKPH